MSEIDDAIERNRARIDDAESRVRGDLIRLYDVAYDRVEGDLRAMTRRIEQARAAGEVVNPDWLRRQGRYRSLLASIDTQFLRFGGEARRQLASGQQQAAAIGTASATEQAEAAGYEVDVGSRAPVTTQAQERLVSALQPDSPLHDVIGGYGKDARAVSEEDLFSGLAEGVSPTGVERAIRQRIGGEAVQWRLAALARTEMMRANRGALVDQYEQMGVRRVVWRAARSTRTCLACLALDGTEYDIGDAPTYQHVNCWCILSPVPANLYAESRDAVQTGAEWFDSLPVDTQRSMMPTQAAFDAYQANQITLKDFIGERRDPVWGTSIYQRSGRDVLGGVGGGGVPPRDIGGVIQGPPATISDQSPDVIAAANRLYARAARAEPGVTRDLRSLEPRIDGDLNRPFKDATGETVHPLDRKLKTVESTRDKVARDANDTLRDEPSLPTFDAVRDAADNVNDNLRYTYTVAEDTYGRSVNTVVSGLDEMGYEQIALKNSWENEDGYASIHAIYRTGDGPPFEVQFHTDRTIEVKEVTSHQIYERQRKQMEGSPEWNRYQREVDALWRSIRDDPPNLTELP